MPVTQIDRRRANSIAFGHELRPGHPARDGVEAPRALAGLRVVRVDESADAVLGAGDADDHLVLDDERREGHRVAGAVIDELDVEQHAAGLHVERDQMRIERPHEQPIAEDAEAAVDGAAAQLQLFGQLTPVAPDLPPVRASIAHAVR